MDTADKLMNLAIEGDVDGDVDDGDEVEVVHTDAGASDEVVEERTTTRTVRRRPAARSDDTVIVTDD
jgi:hypothetical protein